MDSQTRGPRRARRSQYGSLGSRPPRGSRSGRGPWRPVVALLLAACILAVGIAAYRAVDLLHRFSGFTNPLEKAQNTLAPAPGSIA